MSSFKRGAIPAGAEDDDDDDDDYESGLHGGDAGNIGPGFGGLVFDGGGDADRRRSFNSCFKETRGRPKAPRRPEDGIEEFRRAITRGQTDSVLALINGGFDVNATTRSGWSPLMYAVEAGNVDAVNLLLEKGANAKHHIDGFTVLMNACKGREPGENCLSIVKSLIESQGSDPKGKDRYHSTPLMYSAMEGHGNVVDYLLDHCKVPVDAYDARGHTALMLAVKRGQPTVASSLLDRGADPDKLNADGKSAKDLAIDGGNVDLINLLHYKDQGDRRISELDSYNGISLYGEMESFLYGLHLHDLIDVFKREKIEFKQLLLLSEADLLHLGVKMGEVKRVSEAIHAIHKQPWNKTSLHRLDPKSRNVLTCAEAAAVLANIAKHASLMCTTVGYALDQIETHASVLESGVDNRAALHLRRGVGEALSNAGALRRELDKLRGVIEDSAIVAATRPVDLIGGDESVSDVGSCEAETTQNAVSGTDGAIAPRLLISKGALCRALFFSSTLLGVIAGFGVVFLRSSKWNRGSS